MSDILREATTGIVVRPWRSLFTMLGTAVGVAAYVALLGITSTVSAQVGERFDALTATEVVVQQREGNSSEEAAFSDDGVANALRLNGVEGAAFSYVVGREPKLTTALPDTASAETAALPVAGRSAGSWPALGAVWSTGRGYDASHETHRARVAVISERMAERLQVNPASAQSVVYIEGVPFHVIGILNNVQRSPSALLSVSVPIATARELWGSPTAENNPELLLVTAPGAAQQVAQEVGLALNPATPDVLKVRKPLDPKEFRKSVDGDLALLFRGLSAVLLGVGFIIITVATLLSVMERVPEIGLRRATGARRRHIVALFMMEASGIGLIGGVVGSLIAVAVVVGVSAVQGWSVVMDALLVLLAPLMGLAIGIAAGVVPAWRAASIQPTAALRS